MYTIIWTYRIDPDHRARFIEAYRSGGRWSTFFKTGAGYLGTEFFQNPDDPDVFLTLDRWQSASAYDAFARAHGEEYERIDRECDAFTISETRLGEFGRD